MSRDSLGMTEVTRQPCRVQHVNIIHPPVSTSLSYPWSANQSNPQSTSRSIRHSTNPDSRHRIYKPPSKVFQNHPLTSLFPPKYYQTCYKLSIKNGTRQANSHPYPAKDKPWNPSQRKNVEVLITVTGKFAKVLQRMAGAVKVKDEGEVAMEPAVEQGGESGRRVLMF